MNKTFTQFLKENVKVSITECSNGSINFVDGEEGQPPVWFEFDDASDQPHYRNLSITIVLNQTLLLRKSVIDYVDNIYFLKLERMISEMEDIFMSSIDLSDYIYQMNEKLDFSVDMYHL